MAAAAAFLLLRVARAPRTRAGAMARGAEARVDHNGHPEGRGSTRHNDCNHVHMESIRRQLRMPWSCSCRSHSVASQNRHWRMDVHHRETHRFNERDMYFLRRLRSAKFDHTLRDLGRLRSPPRSRLLQNLFRPPPSLIHAAWKQRLDVARTP